MRRPAEMSAGEINRELDRLTRSRQRLVEEFIARGRGRETALETRAKNDPLAVKFNAITDRYSALRYEVERRYGPRAPSRLPRGFGAIGRDLRPSAGRTSKIRAGYVSGGGMSLVGHNIRALSAEHRRMLLVAEDTWDSVYRVDFVGESRVKRGSPLEGKARTLRTYRVQLHSFTGPVHWLAIDDRGRLWEK